MREFAQGLAIVAAAVLVAAAAGVVVGVFLRVVYAITS